MGFLDPPGLMRHDLDSAATALQQDPDSDFRAAQNATILDKIKTDSVPKWKANTAYTAGDKVVSPNGDIVSAVAAFTSGASYNAGNWALTPSFIVSGLAGREKNDAGIAKAMQPFHSALSKRNTGVPVDMMVIGHSQIEGVGQTTLARRLTNRFLEEMRRKYQPAGVKGGSGYTPPVLPTSIVANGGTITNTPFTYQGVPNLTNYQYGLGQSSVWLQASGDGMTYTFTGTGIDIFWVKTSSGGSFSYSVDGAAATNVSTNGTPVADGSRTQIRGLSSASHTITLAFVSGPVNVVTGFMVYDGDEAAGLRLWNGGHGSWKSNNYANTSPNWMDTIPAAQPSLVAIALTLNDYSTSVTAATFKTNIQTIMTNVKAKCTTPPTFMLIAEPGRGDTASPIEPYPNYVDKLYEIAASDPTVMVLDLYRRLGITPVTGITNVSSGGLINVDKVHFSDFGAQWVADMMTALASPS